MRYESIKNERHIRSTQLPHTGDLFHLGENLTALNPIIPSDGSPSAVSGISQPLVRVPMIDAARSAALVRYLEERKSAADVLCRVGLDRAALMRPGARIPFARHVALLEAAADALHDDLLGVRLGCTFDTSQGGLYSFILLNAATVRAVLLDSARYCSIHNEGVRWQIADDGKNVSLQYFIADAGACGSVQQIGFAIASVCHFFRQVTSEPVMPECIDVEYVAGCLSSEAERLLGAKVRYAAPRNAVVFSRRSCDAPIIGGDSHLYRILTSYADQALADRRMTTDLVDQVQDWLVKQLPGGNFDTEAAARALGMSVRTLSRRLAQRATSYGQIVGELRSRLAQRYVSDQTLQLARVAYLLGYSDPASFSRSFRQRFGCSPRAYRQGCRPGRPVAPQKPNATHGGCEAPWAE